MPRYNQNLRSPRKTRRQGDPMQAFDALPAPLRAWLRDASLPWSAKSALAIWRKASQSGDPDSAVQRLAQAEARMLEQLAK